MSDGYTKSAQTEHLEKMIAYAKAEGFDYHKVMKAYKHGYEKHQAEAEVFISKIFTSRSEVIDKLMSTEQENEKLKTLVSICRQQFKNYDDVQMLQQIDDTTNSIDKTEEIENGK